MRHVTTATRNVLVAVGDKWYDEDMPKRNSLKQYGEGEFYHCYNRGNNKTTIFVDSDDYGYFLSLIKRHVSREPVSDKTRRQYPHYVDKVDVVAYCLMSNHLHLLLYLKQSDGVELLMRSVMTAYSMYFNQKYKRSGTLFEGRFLASRITTDEYFWHVSRYIHLNPLDIGRNPLQYAYSSVGYIRGDKEADWLHTEWLASSSEEKMRYMQSLEDQSDYHELMHLLKQELANEPLEE